jgi:hypothetical protein
MSNKDELMAKTNQVSNHLSGLMVMLHRLEDKPNVHFEIGLYKEGKSTLIYASRDINMVLKRWRETELTQEMGYRIDVWQDEMPVADIDMSSKKEIKVLFEINKKRVVGIGTTSPVFSTEYETVYRSASAIDCRGEWSRKRYTEPEYVMDIREAPEGEETYHVADIKIKTMVKDVPRMYGKDWLESLIKNHVEGDKGKVLGMPEQLAERIMQVYGRGQA